jgi:predicted  nucleic acid-binding Zn-ribbon protein
MATINVEETTRNELKAYCKKQELTQGDFVKFSLEYFRKSGINPAAPPENIKEEVAKMEKRISQLIAFQKTFEKENLLPLLDVLTKTEGKINLHLSNVRERVEHSINGIAQLVKGYNQLLKEIQGLGESLKGEVTQLKGSLLAMEKSAEQRHNHVLGYLKMIAEHGAAVGTMGASIYDRYQKQKK